MQKDKNVFSIEAHDKWELGDKINNDLKNEHLKERGMRGWVEIYEVKDGNKELISKNNLVVYQGRAWAATRIFNTENAEVVTDKDEFICWFGLGSGGTPEGDPFTPNSPTNLDTDLSTPVGISQTDATCADFYDGWYHKHPFDSVAFEQDPDNSLKYLIVKVTTTIGVEDANGSTGTQLINEAGLFSSLSAAGGYSGDFHLFARVTFPTIAKDNSRQLLFIWYIYV